MNIFKNYLVKNWISTAVFVLVFAFDLIVLVGVRNYYRHPIINRDYIRESGYTGSLVCNGWAFVNGNYYFCDKNAVIVKDKIIDFKGKQYYLDQDGMLVVNKRNYKIDSNVYDIDSDGVISKTAK